jgi:hypothetical protein
MLFELDDDEFEPAFLAEAETYFSTIGGTVLPSAQPPLLTKTGLASC